MNTERERCTEAQNVRNASFFAFPEISPSVDGSTPRTYRIGTSPFAFTLTRYVRNLVYVKTKGCFENKIRVTK